MSKAKKTASTDAPVQSRCSLPFDKIHCPSNGYGRLLCPVGRQRWLMLAGWKLRRTYHGGFHNCTVTGVY